MRRQAQRAIRARLLSSSVVLLGLLLLLMVGAGPAFAGAWWRVSSRAAPTFLVPGQKATIIVAATNVGDAGVNATSTPVTIKDTLPPGLEATSVKGAPAFEIVEEGHQMSCELRTLTCGSAPETLPPFQALDVAIQVNVKPGASPGEQNKVSVQGGEREGEGSVETPGASVTEPLSVKQQSTPFGVEEGGYSLNPEAEGGAPDTQAGSHPFQLTTTLNLNQTVESVGGSHLVAAAPALPKDLGFNLPPGLIGDPRAVPPCPSVDFLALGNAFTNACKPESAIGVVVVTLEEPTKFRNITRAVPLWNLEPAQGEPARFGFEVLTVPVVLDTSVRSGGDYGVSVSVNNAPEAAQILASEVTIWGTPGDPHHDQSRGWPCVLGGVYYVNHEVPCEAPNPRSSTPLLTLPTSCTGPLGTTVEGHSWPVKSLGSEPGQIFSLEGTATEYTLPGMEGCEHVPFSPSIHLESESRAASTPTGLTADVHVPQQSTLEEGALGEADVKATSVTLPAGVQLNPSSANGLQACSEQQIGFEGPAGPDPLSEAAPQPLRFSTGPAQCPDASKVGTVRVRTPLLEHELFGAVYLASQDANPFGSLLALYVVAEDPFSGIRVKLAGEVQLNGSTGQISSTFLDTPQVPFEDFVLEFSGGPRASVSTPGLCGNYQTQAMFTPWSGSEPVASLTGGGEFGISSGPDGTPCAAPRPFTPGVHAGSTSLQAGGFSSFALQITNSDQDQALTDVSLRLPPGVAAMLSSIVPCGEPQAALGMCSSQSEIGQASASVGYGPDPYTVAGGRVYLTGPYAGGPFGLSIVTPTVAGPFNLGLVVVRSAINVDPHTAQVTITSPLPTIVQGVGMAPTGIPLDIKQINVNVNRPGFQFNPTSCNPMRIESTLSGSEGTTAPDSTPFQVANCSELPFKPRLSASTKGQASKANGVAFDVKVESKGLGQANIAKVRLQLPKALPARLTTLQKACTEGAFYANPASCPEGSVIGQATIHTPVLRGPLSGPAYLVSHGGAAFPDVEFVLQGEGITLVLDGKTQIKNQITYSKFESAPDAPFTVFETVLPAGPHSALTANLPEKAHFNLCSSSLSMPTEIVGQNGAVLKQTTKIALQGCKKVKAARPLSRAQLLERALAACRRQHKHSKVRRQACERQSRKRYAVKKTANKQKTVRTHR